MRWLLTYLLMVVLAALQGQSITDSVHTLPLAEKVATSAIKVRINYPVSRAKNLNDVLKEVSSVFVRNYGAGQLASLTVRGTSAAQSDLLWNGIKLNSPSLGQVDASLFSLGMTDRFEINGTSQAGNIGGSFNMAAMADVDSTASLETEVTYGSFNTIRAFAKAHMGNGKVAGGTRVSYMQSDNNYTFSNTYKPGNPKQQLTNAKVQLLHLMQEIGGNVDGHNSLFFTFWLSDAQRQIPPVISKPVGKESQDDYSIRNMLSWKAKYGKITTSITSAFLHDVIRYRNPEISLDEKSIMQAFRNNFAFTYDSLRKFSVTVEAGYDYERAVVSSYGMGRQRHIGRLIGSVRYAPVNSLVLLVKLRQSVYDKTLSPFAPAFMLSYNQSLDNDHKFLLTLNASRTFRFPTLNDLYWVPGGNPNLKPEKGWDGELSGRYAYRHYFSFTATGFAKYITNWIQWTSNGSYWEPRNVKRVFTRGVELQAWASTQSIGRFSAVFMVNYTYTRATNLDPLSPYDLSLNKQLIYVPLHQAKGYAQFYYRKFYLKAVNTFTDAVFITTDNSQALKGYYLLDLEVGKDIEIRDKYEIGVSFRANNVTDRQYQNVAQRPMPGVNFEGTLKFRFNR